MNYTTPVTTDQQWNEAVNITTNDIVTKYMGNQYGYGGGIYLYTTDSVTPPKIVEMNGDHMVTIRAIMGSGNDPRDQLYGIRVYGGNNEVRLGKVDIEASYMSLHAQTDAKITVGDGSRLVTVGSLYGIHSSFNSHIKVGSDSLIQAGDLSLSDSYGYAVWTSSAGGLSSIEIGDRSTITAIGNYNYYGSAIYAQLGGYVSVGDGSTITSAGDRTGTGKLNLGVFADANPSTPVNDPSLRSTVVLGNDVTINTDGTKNNVGIYSANESIVTAGENLTVNTHGSGAGNYGVYAEDGGQVTIKSVSVETEGADSYGLIAWGSQNSQNSKVTVTDGSHIKTMGTDAYGVAASNGGEVELTGKHIIETDLESGSHALWANNGGVITADGTMNIIGNLHAENAGKINMTMRDGSYMKGFSSLDDGQSGEIHVDMKNAYWDLHKQDSELSSLKMAAGATIDYTKESGPLNLYAHDISGNGTFVMKIDIVGGNGDLLITDTSDGDHKIKVMDQGSAPTTGDEDPLTLVKTGDGKAEFTLTGKDNLVDIGAWQYGLRRALENENHWELFTTKKPSPPESAAVNTFMGGYLLAYAETQTLMQRLGDLRDTDYDNGYWFRFHGGRMESNIRSFVRDFDMKYGGAQVGYDRKIKNDWNGDTYVGGYFGYSKGDLDYSVLDGGTGGSGSVDSRTLGLYGTYIADDGFYVDAVLKYMWMKNDFDVLDSDGGHVTGDGLSTGGVGLSLELGKRFRLTKNERGENWYIEPQAQLSYTHQNGGYFNASNGLMIGVDKFNSLLGRIGMLAGYETEKTNIYAKVSYVKEFDGDVNIIANNVSIPESFGDSWWEYGLGFTTKLNDRNSIYMSLERSSGVKFTEPWKVYAGWRITI
ncbi:MAG: autotransporter outer membrane beta-barrel domain-containing protein [Synergistaceae bacterium]|nr:autotransporter outer membrane beta-barrel domain-containing protein [Synergistaceae bacterium]